MIRNVGVYIRVSGKKQAKVKEGSLKNQRQFVDKFLKGKKEAEEVLDSRNEDGSTNTWNVVDYYLEEPKTAAEATRRYEYQRLISDLKRGRINTIVCMGLSRFSRSIEDFFAFVRILKEKNGAIISLRENIDTTSAHGRLIMTILMALNQFEIEVDSQRMKDSIQARSERGLWVSNRLFGFDLNPKRPGYLRVNPREAKIVVWLFRQFLKLGSIQAVKAAANAAGFRMQGFRSRRGVRHTDRPFTFSTVKRILTNRAYIGQAEINKWSLDHKPKKGKQQGEYRIVPAVWDRIVTDKLFNDVQKLMGTNLKTRHNGVRKPSHVYLFGEGLLRCDRIIDKNKPDEKCTGEMRGVSGTSRNKTVHSYYQCRKCRTRIPARAVEDLVRWRLQHLLGDESKVDKLVAMANLKLREELPKIAEQRELQAAELKRLTAEAHSAAATKDVMTGEAQKFLQERLDAIIGRRGQVLKSLESLDRMSQEMDKNMIQKTAVKDLLRDFGRVFSEMAPYKKRELVKKMIGQVRLSELRMAVGLDSDPCAGLQGPEFGPETSEPASRIVLETGSSSVKTGGADGI
ncbi:MAG: recombinase family protein [Elusimicrobiota bacterium]|nr:MAG: recombinase family protein [Elusimicrobiota bacterium]